MNHVLPHTVSTNICHHKIHIHHHHLQTENHLLSLHDWNKVMLLQKKLTTLNYHKFNTSKRLLWFWKRAEECILFCVIHGKYCSSFIFLSQKASEKGGCYSDRLPSFHCIVANQNHHQQSVAQNKYLLTWSSSTAEGKKIVKYVFYYSFFQNTLYWISWLRCIKSQVES